MATVGKPVLKQYRTRFYQILPTIGITLPTGWTSADVNVFTTTGLGQSAFPFWVIDRPSIIAGKVTRRESRWRISWILFLARDHDTGTAKAETIADQIDDDVADVMEYFESRSKLVSSTLTTNMAGYLPGTMALTVNPDAFYPVKTARFVGSAYTLSLTHRIVYDLQNR